MAPASSAPWIAAFTSPITRFRPRAYSAPAAEVISEWAMPLMPSMSTEMKTRSSSPCAWARPPARTDDSRSPEKGRPRMLLRNAEGVAPGISWQPVDKVARAPRWARPSSPGGGPADKAREGGIPGSLWMKWRERREWRGPVLPVGVRLTRRAREEYLVYFDRSATMNDAKRSVAAGMDRRSNAA